MYIYIYNDDDDALDSTRAAPGWPAGASHKLEWGAAVGAGDPTPVHLSVKSRASTQRIHMYIYICTCVYICIYIYIYIYINVF